MLLDEPTSALDSWSEADWFERLRRLAQDRTVLLITHRFTLAKDADLICVMEKGSIVETGGHEELLRNDGRYAAAWRIQTQKASSVGLASAEANGGSNTHRRVGATYG
jgi:ATP-binding cassette subfamily B protein